jgi:hypothetical protein
MLECFIPRNFADGSLEVIDHANQIISEYQAQGFTLTLRQLYYQFIARDLFPNDRRWVNVGGDKWKRSQSVNATKNATPNYKWLGSIVNDGRLAGLIDWSAMEDRLRTVEFVPSWDDPESILDAVGDQYKEDLWAGQEYRPEVWIEKDALAGVIENVCRRWRVPHFACRGYTSQSAQYEAGKRFKNCIEKGQIPIVLHLGDTTRAVST